MNKNINFNDTRWFNVYTTLMLVNITNSSGNSMGLFTIIITILLSILIIFDLLFIKKKIKKLNIKILLVTFCIAIIQICGINKNISIRAIVVISQFISMIAIFIAVNEKINLRVINLKYYKNINKILISIIYLEIILSTRGINLNIIYNNTNTLAMICQIMIFINLLIYSMGNFKKKYIILYLPALIISSGRSSIAAVAILFIVMYFWKIMARNKMNFIFIYFLILSILTGVTWLYPNMYKLKSFNYINLLSLEYFGKSIYSGREFIWKDILNVTEGNRILGLGTGVLPRDFISWGGSSHNQYLDLLFQNGLVLCVLVAILFYIIWCFCYKFKKNKSTAITIGIIIGILVSNCFEVTLFQNNLAIGIMSWISMALGIGGMNFNEVK